MTLLNVRDRTPFTEQLAPHCEGGVWDDMAGFRLGHHSTDAFGYMRTKDAMPPLALRFEGDPTPILEMRRVTNSLDTAVFFTDGWVAVLRGEAVTVSRLRRR